MIVSPRSLRLRLAGLSRLPRPLRSLGNRLATIFALIVLGAIGIVYFSVAPRLQERLSGQKRSELVEVSRRFSAPIEQVAWAGLPEAIVERRARLAAARASAEVLVLRAHRGALTQLTLDVDSTPDGGLDIDDMRPVAERALLSRRTASATASTRLGSQALAARPVFAGDDALGVIVYADGLSDVQANVRLIQRQILASGAAALLVAVVAGYLVARALSARVGRLEHAARKVAAGDFSNPIRADSDDELGQLAAAFDDMQNQLARLDRARKQFIASASHELRTPIFSLGGFLELLADEDLDEETRRAFLAQLQGQVERMRKLATELLDLSRLEAGALELRPEPTDLGRLARDVTREFTPAITQHGSDIDLRVHEPVEADCDPERVAQVVRILLDNALVHTPAGTPIVVSAARRDGHVRLEVSDRGPGIKRHNMPHIFEPFFSSDDDAHGAGLGLAIARELAGTMRGELQVQSSERGTTFTLDLPG
jgi:two-component system, OmpR family, sensor kinase